MKKIAVLMSTYNGEKYLKEQLDSILNQRNVDVDIIVRDDGSNDKTIEILNDYRQKKGIKFYNGKNLKPAKSFLDLLKNCNEYDYYAFADQDDYWEENKLEKAIEQLEKSNSKNGKLYFSTLKVVDSNLNMLYKSNIPKIVTLKNEMIKNYATGCTMVFDNNMKNIVNKINCNYIAMHDSYVFRLALINNSYIYIDYESYILYRQHENNVLGMTDNFLSVWKNRWHRFIHSECISSNTSKEFINNKNIFLQNDDYEFLYMLSNYKKNRNLKLKLLKMKIFGKDEKLTNFLFKIKLIFDKI